MIFSVLGIKRNIMAFLGLILILGIHVLLILWLVPMGISIPLVLPLVYVLALIGFMTTYAAYPIIDRYMIAPYASDPLQENIEEAEETME